MIQLTLHKPFNYNKYIAGNGPLGPAVNERSADMTTITSDTDFVQVQLTDMADLDSYQQFGEDAFGTYKADCSELLNIIHEDGVYECIGVDEIEDLENLLAYVIENVETAICPMTSAERIQYVHNLFVGKLKAV